MLFKQVRMTAGSNEHDLIGMHPINQEPVGRDVAFATILVLPSKGMISMLLVEPFPREQLSHDHLKFGEFPTSSEDTLGVLLELRRPAERSHATPIRT